MPDVHMLAIARQVQVDVSALSMLEGLVIPLIVGLITKARANRAVKSVSLAVLSVIAGLISLAAKADGNIDLYTSAEAIITAFITAIASYYGFWKPTGVAPAIAGATPDVGIGSNNPVSPMSDTTLVEPTSTSASSGTPGTVDVEDAVGDDQPREVYRGQHYRKD